MIFSSVINQVTSSTEGSHSWELDSVLPG